MEDNDDVYMKISHSQRINVVYMKTVHNLSIVDIEKITGLKYNSIRNIINTYKKDGRTNRKNGSKSRSPLKQGARYCTLKLAVSQDDS